MLLQFSLSWPKCDSRLTETGKSSFRIKGKALKSKTIDIPSAACCCHDLNSNSFHAIVTLMLLPRETRKIHI